jgi:hypothetical protein
MSRSLGPPVVLDTQDLASGTTTFETMADSTRQLPRYLTDRPSQQLLSQLPVHASMGRSGCWPWSPSGRSCTTRSAICGGRIPLTRRSEGRGSGRGPAHGRWRLPRLHLTFVLRAVGAERTRLLVRTCGTYACGGRPGLRPSRPSSPGRELGQRPMTSRAPTGGAQVGDVARSCSWVLATGHMTRCWSVRRAG